MANQQELVKLLSLLDTPEKKAALLDAISNKDKTQAQNRFDLKKVLFKEQLEVTESDAKNLVVVTSRRAGKSTMIAAYLLTCAMKTPESVHLYVSLTKASARNIIWAMLTRMIEDYSLPFTYNEHTLSIKGSNRSRILIEGAHDQNSIERLRGMALHTAVIDEAQSFPTSLATSLVSEIIAPSLKDYDGKMMLAGTPCVTGKSVLALAWNGDKPYKGYTKYHWNVTHNIKFPRFVNGVSTPDTYLKEIRDETGYKETDGGYIREFIGKFTNDSDSLVYGFDEDRDTCDELPSGHEWNYIVAADAGYVDSDAILCLAFSYTHRIAYVVECYSEAGQDFSSFAEKIAEFNDKYKPIDTIIDPAGGGKKVVEELNSRYRINARAAEKYNPKVTGTAIVASEFRREGLKVLNNDTTQLLIAQLSNITYITKTDKDGNVKRVVPDGKQVVTSQGVIGDDIADSLLYAHRCCRNYLAEEFEPISETEHLSRKIQDHKQSVVEADRRRAYEQSQRSNGPTWF
jgi:hypothetical protein